MTDHPDGWVLAFEDDFDGPDLDPAVWLPHYLPAWSSRAQTAASYELRDSCLHLRIPPDQGLWCADDHRPPMRVSGIQSGNFSGPVGGTRGQQPYRDGVRVREAQEHVLGLDPVRRVHRAAGPCRGDTALDGRRSGWSASRTSPRGRPRSA